MMLFLGKIRDQLLGRGGVEAHYFMEACFKGHIIRGRLFWECILGRAYFEVFLLLGE